MIAIVDYGMGNLRSVQKAFEKIGVTARIVPFPRDLERVRGIVLPGVGAFGQAMNNLCAIGWDVALRESVARGVPLLGICLGMQLLFESSEEMGQHAGLGILRGAVKRFDGTLKVPQMGWNQLYIQRPSALLRDVADGSYAFFVHSYYCVPRDQSIILATTDYGIKFASVVGYENVFGAQFHPEKSQSVGLKMLANFAEFVEQNTHHVPRNTHHAPRSTMIIFPAIDLRNGRVVRLQQGRAEAETKYSDDPAQVALRWQSEGAQWLHVVNLDGAFGDDSSANARELARIISSVSIPIQFGGGLRDLASIEAALALGVARVVIGTAAVENPQLVSDAIARWGAERIVVGIDAREGMVATRGWVAQSKVSAIELAQQMRARGVERIVYTDIARDGMMRGIDAEAIAQLARTANVRVIASGGVASVDDVRALRAYREIEGVIIGQALYTNTLRLREVLDVGKTDHPLP